MHSSARIATLLWISLVAVGCRSGSFADPNDPNIAGSLTGEQMQLVVRGIYENLAYRVRTGEITEARLRKELVSRTREFSRDINLENLDPGEAFAYGEVLRTAEEWDRAEIAFAIAMNAAKTPDQRVNAALRLAHCQAKLGKAKDAIALARSTFDAPPGDKGAILPAVLLEIAPALERSKVDKELASLLVDSVTQHLQVSVDPATPPGKAFLVARPFHVRNAMDMSIRLYRRAGDFAAAERAAKRRRNVLASLAMQR